jgi:hypothetical protein
MVLTCNQCRRANPANAIYCHFDGFVLAGRGGGPLPAGSQRFRTPFVLPSGRTCRCFDELALGCDAEWEAARDLLENGTLERFLGVIGRGDLALCARSAAKFPDSDRGLHQLLSALPGTAFEPPRLSVNPTEIHLGKLRVCEDRAFEIRLENKGIGLVFGTVACAEGVWLAVGEHPGAAKNFQCRDETSLTVRVRGDRLRAESKPLHALLVIESNGGGATVSVRADVPITPIHDGLFAGCRSPRQVAERARTDPKAAATHFQSGAIARWYECNGWTYPVQGQVAAGLGAVQQFFEALGLTTPPKVETCTSLVDLAGEPGQPLEELFEIHTNEKRPVYAHATSNVPWLRPGAPRLNGRSASIPLYVPAIPDRPGETLDAKLTVHANGHQRFVIPVKLRISHGRFDFSQPTRDATVRLPDQPMAAPGPAPATVGELSGEPSAQSSSPASGFDSLAIAPSSFIALDGRRSHPLGRGARTRRANWIHALPLAVLTALLAAVVVVDAVRRPTAAIAAAEVKKRIGYTYGELADSVPRLAFNRGRHRDLRFGLVLPNERDPREPAKAKRLTYDENGASNNTCVVIDGVECLLGRKPGRLVAERYEAERYAWLTEWLYDDADIHVTQTVQIVPGARTGLLDTCLIRYALENRGTSAHQLGLRVLIDTFIGAEDGVPFRVAGRKELVTRPTTFAGAAIPAHIEALERSDPANPGTVAYLGLKDLELPDVAPEPLAKVLIGAWPGSEKKWDWEEEAASKTQKIKDSAVALYWEIRPTRAGETRQMAFSYGLNNISPPQADGALALSTGGSFQIGSEFTVTAYIKKPTTGERFRIELPTDAFELADGEAAEADVSDEGTLAHVSWRVRSKREGKHSLAVASKKSRASIAVTITNRSLFQ